MGFSWGSSVANNAYCLTACNACPKLLNIMQPPPSPAPISTGPLRFASAMRGSSWGGRWREFGQM